MPARAKSLNITERYRGGMIRLRKQGQREARRIWNGVSPDALDATFNVGSLEMTVTTLQREAARLSSAYLASFVASELGEPERPPPLNVWDKAFGGGDLRTALRSPVIKAKTLIGEGVEPREATNRARVVLVNDVGLFIDTAARESLRQGMVDDDRIEGYVRAIKGTCAACAGMAEASVAAPGTPLEIHPGCQCVAEPVTRPESPKAGGEAIRGQLERWGNVEATEGQLAEAAETWTRNLERAISQNPIARQVLRDAIEANEAAPEFQALMRKYAGGQDTVVLLDSQAVKEHALLSFDDFTAAKRLADTTFVSDDAVLVGRAASEHWSGLLRHEFGHSVWDAVPGSFRSEFTTRLRKLPELDFTDYPAAKSQPSEAFSEALRVITDPRFDAAKHSSEFRELAAWMKGNL